MSEVLSVRVAELALSTFEALPQRCKPRIQADGRREWAPMSAIVIVSVADEDVKLKCVSVGLGTKCLAASQIRKCSGLVLHDSHAEVLAFRGLNRWLLNEVHASLNDPVYISEFVEACAEDHTNSRCPFRLRDNIHVYMFTTTAPCGDASMELLISSSHDSTSWSMETLAADLSTGQPLGRGHFSILGAVRRKPARGDAESTMSKSCTDKIAVKQFTGLLSFPADTLLRSDDKMFLRGVVTYEDQYDEVGYKRALGKNGRLSAVTDVETSYFNVHILPKTFPRFEFERTSGQKSKVTNISAIYVAGTKGTAAVHEVLVNGVKQGYKQFEDRPGKGSVLCRRNMLELGLKIRDLLFMRGTIVDGLESGKMYGDLKKSQIREQRLSVKKKVTQKLGGWVTNSAEDDFEVGDRAQLESRT